jgi:hypothetical protein
MPTAEDPEPLSLSDWMRRYIHGYEPAPPEDDIHDLLTEEQWHRLAYERWRYEQGELNER